MRDAENVLLHSFWTTLILDVLVLVWFWLTQRLASKSCSGVFSAISPNFSTSSLDSWWVFLTFWRTIKLQKVCLFILFSHDIQTALQCWWVGTWHLAHYACQRYHATDSYRAAVRPSEINYQWKQNPDLASPEGYPQRYYIHLLMI